MGRTIRAAPAELHSSMFQPHSSMRPRHSTLRLPYSQMPARDSTLFQPHSSTAARHSASFPPHASLFCAGGEACAAQFSGSVTHRLSARGLPQCGKVIRAFLIRLGQPLVRAKRLNQPSDQCVRTPQWDTDLKPLEL